MASDPVRVQYDQIAPALKKLMSGLNDQRMVFDVAANARAVIIARTNAGKSLTGSAFPKYKSGGTYYAPIKKRPPGYPSPKGGRRKALRGGRTLKTAAYDAGYGDYKSRQGFGGNPQLSVAGRMLGDIQIRVINPKRAELFFGNRLNAAKAHRHHHGKYPFFGINVTEQKNMIGAIASYLRQLGVT